MRVLTLNFNQRTTTTHTTLQVRQSLFNSTVTEISTRNEIPLQNLLKDSLSQRRIRLLDSLSAWVSCAHSKENSLYPGTWSGRDRLDRLLFYFMGNCYVTNVKCSTTQSLNSLNLFLDLASQLAQYTINRPTFESIYVLPFHGSKTAVDSF